MPLNLLPAQLRLEVEPGPVVAPGAILKAHLATLPMKTPVRVDVWAGEVLVASHTDVPEHGALELETALPAEVRGLVRLEAYRILWDPAAHLNTAAVWVSDRALPEAVDDAWALLATLPGGDSIVAWASAAPPEARARLLSLALSRVGPERPGLPLLRSDLEERRLALQAEITRLRGHAHALMLGSAVVGLLAGAVWAVRHRAQTRRSLRAALAEGAAQGDDLDSADADPMTRMRPTYELVLVCVTVLLAIYGAWVVVSRIGWSF